VIGEDEGSGQNSPRIDQEQEAATQMTETLTEQPAGGTPSAVPTSEELEAARPWYSEQLAGGVQRFLEARRDTCPWCGWHDLKTVLRTGDLMQRKPGRFTMDACRTCGHVFQNPRLNVEGLNFYYKDFYDGLGAHTVEMIFAAHHDIYLDRARMLAPFITPKNWLDVGTGYGHFCKDAREIWPDTTFDGLDMGVAVLEGKARGWLDNIHHGQLPDLADEVAHRYDVVSMHHYLEHVRDPRAELDVLSRVVAPGKFLLIEVPDPESVTARIFGKLWAPWFQPQHQNLIPCKNLLQALRERGFTAVTVHRASAHIPVDVTCAVLSVCTVLGPDPRLPWRKPGGKVGELRKKYVWKAAPPVVKAAYKADLKLAPVIRRFDGGNAYRILARKD
jgi:SAM-dependent methyltransferase